MPRYDFRCQGCGAVQEVEADYALSRTLELTCAACGGTMIVAPVLRINVVAPNEACAGGARPADCEPCGHACRCAVNLDRPNPFGPGGE
jgi:hypothetical protein